MKIFVFVTLASFVALSQCGIIKESQETEVAPYTIVDSIIKVILESLRPKLANMKFNNINETIKDPKLNASLLVKDIMIKNADTFVIRNLKSKVVPLQLVNLTLTWNNITASAGYDIDANLSLSNNMAPIRFFAKGDARASLENIFFTIGANFEFKNNVLQIKPNGLFGFDLIVKRVNVALSSILGNTDFAKSISVLISQIIPQLIDTLKKPLFDAYQNDIIKIINQVLKKNGTTFMDEEPTFEETPLLQTLDLSEEMGSFLGDSFFHSVENYFQPNF